MVCVHLQNSKLLEKVNDSTMREQLSKNSRDPITLLIQSLSEIHPSAHERFS